MSLYEVALQFGADEHLLGVFVSPETRRPDAPACLMINSGVIHRIGPHRLNVKLARALAAQGIPSLRFDLSGLGDSPSVAGATHFRDQAVLDMKAAMDHLEATQGIRRFLVFGICSGAVNAYVLALADPRVVGVVMFDAFVYPTFKTHVLRRWKRFQALPWSALAKQVPLRLKRLLVRPAARVPEASEDAHLAVPSREEFARSMEQLVTRGVSVYLFYSGSFLEGHNYEAQLRDAFAGAPFLDRIRYDFAPDVDHTATSLAAQRKVMKAVCDWVASIPPAPAAQPA